MALGDVALPAAVVVEVDGEAEGDVAVGDGPLDVAVDPGLVAAHVELEDLGVVVAGGNRFETRRGDGAQPVVVEWSARVRAIAAPHAGDLTMRVEDE